MFFIYFVSFLLSVLCFFFFFNDTATTEIYTLSLHDALPISDDAELAQPLDAQAVRLREGAKAGGLSVKRSEEHTSELQSRENLVCRLLLEKKNKQSHEIESALQWTGATFLRDLPAGIDCAVG